MKKIIFMFIMLGWVMNSSAQTKATKSPEQKATKIVNKLSKELSLSPEQQSKIYSIALDKATKMAAIKAQNSTNQKAVHAQTKSIKDSYNAEINAVLTPGQVTAWNQIKAQQKENHQQNKQNKAGFNNDGL